ncbi:MAG: response regulator [Candidatus Accumulibacter sp.]|jgi:putative two-component system response regulator|nr:response regulator [Accumulibacter sp.]
MGNSRKLIMLVDDNRTNLLTGKTVLSECYTVLTASSAAKMFETLEWSRPELILLDIDMPEMNGFEAIRILKERPGTRDISVIFLTARDDSDDELEGLQLGAVDYITKPFSPPLLRKRVELHLLMEEQKRALQEYNDNLQNMVEAKTRTILKLQNKILTAMAEMVEGRDNVTGSHIANTQRYLGILLSAVIDAGLWKEQTSEWDIELLLQSSQLHDVGKIAIRDSILKKPGKLSREEFEEMKQHVVFGVGFIERLEDGEEDSRFLQYAKIFAAFHHEKWDGSGYPHGLSGEDIPLLGRMMAIVDVYDALTSRRPYTRAFSHEEAARIIVKGKGTHFDPTLVDLFEPLAGMFRQSSQPAP